MKQSRNGTTLVELLVVISVCSVVVGVSGVLLHSIYRVDKDTRLAIESEAAVDRLSLQFRRDAHAASRAELLTVEKGAAAGVVFRGPAELTVEYRRRGRAIVRTAKSLDKVVHTDSYGLPAGTELVWKLDAGQPSVAAVQIARPPQRGVKLPAIPQQRLEAVVGLVQERRGAG